MSSFSLKLLALCAMLFDHAAAVFFRCGLLAQPLCTLLRTIGRISFPLFAWQAVQGWRHTANRPRHVRRLLAGALVSAVPYSLCFARAPESGLTCSAAPASWLCTAVCVCAVCWGIWHECAAGERAGTLALALPAVCLPLLRLRLGALTLLSAQQSIFHTLIAGLLLCELLAPTRALPRGGRCWRALALLSFLGYAAPDYGLRGLLLLAAFSLCREAWQCAAALVGFALLGAGAGGFDGVSLLYAAGCCAAIAPLTLANGQRGRGSGRLFYIFYPAHLLALGLLQAMLLRAA